MKVCSRCKTSKSLGEFKPDPRYRLGVTGLCRKCYGDLNQRRKAEITLLPKPNIPEKRCSACRVVKSATDFYRSSASLDGYMSRCRPCHNAAFLMTRLKPERMLKGRLRIYGMTPEDLYSMITAQKSLCEICREPFAKPYIDHDHDSGVVRALLCCRCNNWLTAIEHPTFRHLAEDYLQRVGNQPTRFRVNKFLMEQRQGRKAKLRELRRA